MVIRQRLRKKWDDYLTSKRIHKVRCVKRHRETLISLFLPLESEGKVVELGCGDGILFKDIADKILIKGGVFYGFDWAPETLKKAKERANEISKKSNIHFKLKNHNLAKGIPLPDDSVDIVMSLLFLCYLPGGWKDILNEVARVLKPGGYYYGAPLNDENFIRNAIHHFVGEFFHQPLTSIMGLSDRKKISDISNDSKIQGAEYPEQSDLVDYLNSLGFKEVKLIPTFWGGGSVIRAHFLNI